MDYGLKTDLHRPQKPDNWGVFMMAYHHENFLVFCQTTPVYKTQIDFPLQKKNKNTI